MLQAENISVVIGDKTLINIASLNLVPGNLVGVVGPNGAGKSTTLKVMSGEQVPTTGKVVMNGRDLDTWRVNEKALTRAVLPQASSLSFAFRVVDVVMMGRSPHYKTAHATDDREVVELAMRMTDTVGLADRVYTDLSGGEKQRVHLARVLAQLWAADNLLPKYLLLDEPTSALDLAHQHQTLSIVRAFTRQQNVGALVILHDLNLASLYVDTLIMLKHGELKAVGAPADILNAEMVESVFDYPVSIVEHPEKTDCPMVIVSPIASSHSMLDSM